MKKTLLRGWWTLVAFFVTYLPVGAQHPGNPGAQSTSGSPPPTPAKLENPLSVDSIEELLMLVLDVLLIFAVPIIIFFIIYSGFLYVTAQGKPEQIKKATTAFTWTVIGGVIILGAKLLLEIIVNTVNAL